MLSRTFAGPVYQPRLDRARLTLQIERIRAWAITRDWFTLREARVDLERLYSPTLFPQSSISAQLRNTKKFPYRHGLAKRRRSGVHGAGSGVWEYRLLAPAQSEEFFSSHSRFYPSTHVGSAKKGEIFNG
jgi:hypothetical protein